MSGFANDPYCYPGTDILRNLEDIRDRKAPEGFEADAVAAREPLNKCLFSTEHSIRG